MSGRKTGGQLPLDFEQLRERVEQDAAELRREVSELKKFGNELKATHMRRMIHPQGYSFARRNEQLSERYNKVCLRCLNSCKQTDAVKLVQCPNFSPAY